MTTSSSHAAPAPVRLWAAFSNGLVFVELRVAAALLLALAFIILTNV